MVIDIEQSPALSGHVATALSDLRARQRYNGLPVPAGYAELEATFASWARRGQRGTNRLPATEFADAESAPQRLLVSYAEAAELLNCSDRTVKRLVAAGKLPAVKVEGLARIRRADLDRYTAALSPTRETA